MQDEKILIELARLILPSGFVENFKITSVVSIPKIGLQKTDINCNPNLVQNDNKT